MANKDPILGFKTTLSYNFLKEMLTDIKDNFTPSKRPIQKISTCNNLVVQIKFPITVCVLYVTTFLFAITNELFRLGTKPIEKRKT